MSKKKLNSFEVYSNAQARITAKQYTDEDEVVVALWERHKRINKQNEELSIELAQCKARLRELTAAHELLEARSLKTQGTTVPMSVSQMVANCLKNASNDTEDETI